MILDFARVYDPQPFHIDAEAARQTMSKHDRGIVRVLYRMMNQRQEVVLTMLAMHLLKRKSAT